MENEKGRSTCKETAFTPKHSQIVKGFAVILMMVHHLFSASGRLASDINIISSFRLFTHTAHYEWGLFGRICVSLFLFVTGFGLYRKQMNGKEIRIIPIIRNLYIRYWRIFVLFVPFGFMYFGYAREAFPESLRVFSKLDWQIVISDFFGFTSQINTEWWFLRHYIICLCVFPLWAAFVRNHRHEQNILMVVVFSVFFSQIFPYLKDVVRFPVMDAAEYNLLATSMDRFTIASFFAGVAFAKDHLLEQLYKEIVKPGIRGIIQDLFLFCMVFFCRQYGFGHGFDWLYAPILCLIIWDLTDQIQVLGCFYNLFGKHSTNIWFFHTFFCYYYDEVQKLIYSFQHPPLIVLFFILLCLFVSIGIEVFYDVLIRILRYISGRLKLKETKE